MLNNYSPYKIVENFRRIKFRRVDLGIGSAPGGDEIATLALRGKTREDYNYANRVNDLLDVLTDKIPCNHSWTNLTATPIVNTLPEVWMLGASKNSAVLAGQRGLPYSFAIFINNKNGPAIIDKYINNFESSLLNDKPKVCPAVYVICGESKDHANWLSKSLDYINLQFEKGLDVKSIPSSEELIDIKYTKEDKKILRNSKSKKIVGDIDFVENELYKLSKEYKTNEIMINTITFDFKEKLNSFKRIADRFHLF